MRQVRYGPFHGPWCQYVQYCMQRRGLNQTTLGRLIDVSQASVQAYVTGRMRPQLEQMDKWARALALTKKEHEEFVWLAFQAWTPPEVWGKLKALERHLFESQQKISELRALLAQRTPTSPSDAQPPAPSPSIETSQKWDW